MNSSSKQLWNIKFLQNQLLENSQQDRIKEATSFKCIDRIKQKENSHPFEKTNFELHIQTQGEM